MRNRIASGFVEYAKLWSVLAVIIALGFVAAYQFVPPAPPRTVRIATGGKGGAYYAFAQKYAPLLARDGIHLEIVPTAGSLENLELVRRGEVTLALVQGGAASAADREQLQSLGSLFLEPVWVFYRRDSKIKHLSELKGKSVAVGAAGSGTYFLAERLLAAEGVTKTNAVFLHENMDQAVPGLLAGKLTAAFFVASPEARIVKDLMRDPAIDLLSFERASAYTYFFGFLNSVTLHEGVLDLQQDIPSHDTKLVAVAASLVARNDLNESLIPAVLKAVTEVHQEGGVLEQKRQFPSADVGDFHINDDAARYITNGPSFLHRWFPYRTAVLLDRLKILVVPFVALLIPVFRIAPPLYTWRIRSRIFRWYAAVREIDGLVLQGGGQEEATAALNRLKNLEKEVASVSVPLSYTGELYHLRLHIAFVEERLAGLIRSKTNDA
jgi:TRAP transporter TAXI family solute receptor